MQAKHTMNAIVTGATKGIGLAIATKFVQQGVHTLICARNKIELEKTKQLLNTINTSVMVYTYMADLSKKNEAITFGNFVLEQFSTIDILVNNTGVFIPNDISTEPDGMLETLMETNVYSAYYLTRTLLPQFKKQMNGHIFNICSVASHQPYPQGGSYSISKYALLGFSKNLREELKPSGIKVTSISPGATMSNSWRGSNISEERILKAQDIAEVVWSAYNLSAQAVVEDIIIRPQLGDV